MKNPKIIRMSAKCSDLFSATLANADATEQVEYDGYVPDFFPGDHYGDYVQFDIDINTGKILNWKKPTAEQLADTFKEDKD